MGTMSIYVPDIGWVRAPEGCGREDETGDADGDSLALAAEVIHTIRHAPDPLQTTRAFWEASQRSIGRPVSIGYNKHEYPTSTQPLSEDLFSRLEHELHVIEAQSEQTRALVAKWIEAETMPTATTRI